MAWTPLNSRELRLLCFIEAETRTPNGQGGFTTGWTKLADAWAKKVPLRGNEVLQDGVLRTTSVTRFVIRFRTDVTTKHRLVEKASGTVWNIRRVEDPYGRRDRLELDCESGVST